MRVIFVRHGESTFNVESRVQGHGNLAALTDKGIAMARQVGTALQGVAFTAIYTSPLQRASQTAAEIINVLAQSSPSAQTAVAAPLPQPIVAEDLIEIDVPLWEGWLFSEVKERDPVGYQHWKTQPEKLCMQLPNPDGSTTPFYPVVSLYAQAKRFWQFLFSQHPDGTLLLVGHSGINRALIGTALGLGPESYLALQQSNCGISVLNFPDGPTGAAQLESLNQTGHLGQALPKPKEGRTVRLLLVRHGETDWNRQGRFQGQIDVPLNDHGRHQANLAAEFLKQVPVDFAVSSPMLRPRETAELILQHHPQVSLQFMDGLREISHGDWEGKLEPEVAVDFPGELDAWRLHPETVQMPNGENLDDVWQRGIAAWEQIVAMAKADPEQPENRPKIGLVVAHDAINKAILCHVVGLGKAQFWNFKQGNGAVSVIDYSLGGDTDDGKALLQAANLTNHLAGGVLDRTAAGAL
jgi:phosphoserine phosphatase